MSTSKTYQQSLADAGSETRPPMLERGSYIPWASRFRRYINQKRENRSGLTKALDEDCLSAKDMWKRVERLMRGTIQNKVDRETRFTNEFDQFVAEPGEALVSVYNRFAQLMNDLERNDMHFPIVTINTKFLNSLQPEWLKYVTQVRLAKSKKLEKSHDPLALIAHTGSSSRNTSSYYVTHPTSVVDYEDEYQQDDVHTNSEDPLTSAMLLLARAITQNFSTPTNNRLRTSSNTRNQAIIQGDRVNIQSRNSVKKGHYARNCPKPRVRDSKYFMEQMLLAKQDEAGVIYYDEQNDFIFADALRKEEIEELSANICLMARIQPDDNTTDDGPKTMFALISNSEISLNVRDTEDTLDDASKSQQKVYEKMNDPIAVANKQNCWTIDYAQINALYKDFVPQKELSAEQKYFPSSFIPSDKNSNATPSIPASMLKSELCELEKQNDFLKDQLLEVSLKHEVELSVLLNHECVDNSLHAEIEQLKKKSIEIQEGLQARIKILEKDVQRCEKQSVDFELKLQHEKEKHKWDSSFKNKNTNPLDYSWISKMEKLEDENVSLDFTVQSLIKERMNAASSVRRPMNRDSHVKNSVLANSKKPAKKVAVYVRKNKQTDITSENVISNKENVIDVDVANASKAKTLLCVSCMQNVLIPCHDKCFANYKLNVHSNVRRTLSTKSRTPKSYDTTYVVHKTRFSKESTLSKSLDTTYVVSKPKIDVESTSKAKVSSTKKRNLRDKSLSTYMKNKIRTSRIWQKWFESKPNVVWSPVNTKPNGQNSRSSEKQSVSRGQFCDVDLEVAFRSKTCYVRNLEGDDLLTGGRESNLYTISLSNMAASSPVCIMSKATFTKSWLWHRRLSHLNFNTINDLTRLDLVDGLPKFKYGKDHLCYACEKGKRKKASHPLKLVSSDHSKLELLHMDLCGPMRVASINRKKLILVIVDDYSRYTWVYFLHSKVKLLTIIKKIIVRLNDITKPKFARFVQTMWCDGDDDDDDGDDG
ncbi:integrase, catalytic region, zinc finger, CCHC-type containing protein [Tanacetum coccineum]|uniref:Integrase, catalytic region, zinc finger, CCHC-type containing protein n=1 Tax=Tanacetum coccineum TaxID=301880 RepID=A0ABQ5D7X2_9ASTR